MYSGTVFWLTVYNKKRYDNDASDHRHRSGWNSEGDVWRAPKVGRFRMGWGYGDGCPLSSWLEGLGERHELPQWGPGQYPGRKRILAYFEGHRTLLFVYDKNLRGTICTSVPLLQMLGGLIPRVPPVIYAHASDWEPASQVVLLSYKNCEWSGQTHRAPSGFSRHSGEQPRLAQRFFTTHNSISSGSQYITVGRPTALDNSTSDSKSNLGNP